MIATAYHLAELYSQHSIVMKISFWSIGKSHESYIKEGVLDFTKRISRYFPVDWTIIPVPKNAGMLSEMDLKKREGEMVLQWMKADDYLITLDENGKEFSSVELAGFLQQRANEGTRHLGKVIYPA